MTPKELKTLSDQGISVQSHTLTHHPLSGLQDAEVLKGVKESKEEIEKITGKQVYALAPPGNFYRRRFDNYLESAGYTLCFSADKGSNGKFDRDPMRIRRLIVEYNTDFRAFKRLLTPWGAIRTRLIGTIKKVPLIYFTPQQWLDIRRVAFATPFRRRLLTTKGLALVGASILLLVIVSVVFGLILS
jgi:hypothetical protein